MDTLTDFGNRLRKRQKHLGKWARRRGISCWRVYDHDLPDQPAVVEWYNGDAVVWTRRRTRDETDSADADRVAAVVATVRAVLQPARLVHKRRQRQQGRQTDDGPGQYQRFDQRGIESWVNEGELRFKLNLSDYLDVGLFLDHRPTRAAVGTKEAGTRFLNCFAYTGSFTCHARAGGAVASDTVDLSNTYCSWARENLAANGFGDNAAHRIIRGDTAGFLAHTDRRYDLVVCDPPTFSNSKATETSFSVDRDHPQLLAAIAQVTAPGGVCWFSTNSRRFQLATLPEWQIEDRTAATTDEDFERRPAHYCWRLTRIGRS